ncbi:MAG: carbon storage regulator CsrA [Desulfonatronovibrionaceae bacterium]
MLILTRKIGESIHLGDEIEVTVLEMKGRQVRLGLKVPEDMPVYRDELYKKIQSENVQAVQAGTEDILMVADLWKADK